MIEPQITAVNAGEIADAFRELSKQLRKDLIGDIKDVAENVVADARSNALSRMVQRTGDLVKKLRVGRTTLKSVEVQDRALHRGYPYPVVMEYGGRSGGSRIGPRAFLTPAAERNRGRVEDAINDALDKYAKRRDLL